MQTHNWKCHPKKVLGRKESTVRLTSWDKVKQKWNISSLHMATHLENTCPLTLKHLFLVTWSAWKMSSSFHQYRLVLAQCMCAEKSGENGCWQHETLDPSMLSERSAAAYFIWKSMQQNAVNCQTSDFGTYCYTQNSEKARGLWQKRGIKPWSS